MGLFNFFKKKNLAEKAGTFTARTDVFPEDPMESTRRLAYLFWTARRKLGATVGDANSDWFLAVSIVDSTRLPKSKFLVLGMVVEAGLQVNGLLYVQAHSYSFPVEGCR